jgi:putative hydrolase of the HAD superfamily
LSKYEHLFFDLDLTLWDFDANSKEAINELFLEHSLELKGIASCEEFIKKYKVHNERLWDEYRKGIVDKAHLRVQRFNLTLKEFGINDLTLAESIGEGYVQKSPLKTNLFPHAIETLEYLQQYYVLHIITNGFEEVQYVKLENTGLKKYFNEVITSEQAGIPKPAKQIFDYSLNRAGTSAEKSIMIGDNLEIDIIGAKNAGMDQVYFNHGGVSHSENITYEIKSLKDLQGIF